MTGPRHGRHRRRARRAHDRARRMKGPPPRSRSRPSSSRAPPRASAQEAAAAAEADRRGAGAGSSTRASTGTSRRTTGTTRQPTVTADHGALHLEGRYNYEAFETGSAWVGWNFGVGEKLRLDATLMAGGVFGDTRGVAPGYHLTRLVGTRSSSTARASTSSTSEGLRQRLLLQLDAARLLAPSTG